MRFEDTGSFFFWKPVSRKSDYSKMDSQIGGTVGTPGRFNGNG